MLTWMRARLTVMLGLMLVLASCTDGRAPDKATCAETSARVYDEPVAAQTPSSAPPLARREDVSDVLHGVVVPDPYRWLEDEDDPEVTQWVAGQDAWARSKLDALPSRDAIRARIAELMYVGRRGAPSVRGERTFFVTKGARDEKWTYWVADEDAEPRVLFDANTLPEDGSITMNGIGPSPEGKYWAYSMSRNNEDAATLFIKDVATGKDLAQDVIDGARYAWPSWLPDESGFYYTGLPTDPDIPPAEMPGHASVRFHAIGTPHDEDVEVWESHRRPTWGNQSWNRLLRFAPTVTQFQSS